MEKKDLMIGDWVLLTDGPARVISIAQDGIYFEDKFGEGICSFDKIQPIPLTAEILEKNGFTRFGTDYILEERHFRLENPSTPSNYLDNYWLRVSIKAVHIEYVHELQHALKLCGINKTIEV